MQTLNRLSARFIVLENENVDTDQIIPARFLTSTSRLGLGQGLFADWRYDAEGAPYPDFVLNRPEAQGAEVLVVGRNFGCGSSREHAAWALLENGFRVVISTEIADIFRANALKNGVLPVVLPEAVHARLVEMGAGAIDVCVEEQCVRLEDGFEASFPIDPFARHCLINGVDELGFLLEQADAIARYEQVGAAPGAGAVT